MRKFLRWSLRTLAGLILLAGAYAWWTYHGPQPPIEIYHGITYSCETLPDTAESGGLLHLVKADLNVPGVSFYATPLDPDALAHGWEYRLQYVSAVVRRERLAAAVNATLFASDSSWIKLPGDYARSSETVVADRVVNHIDPNTYLMWWDDQNIGHFELTKPPSYAALARAKWGVGGQQPLIHVGKVDDSAQREADQRTMIAFNPAQKIVWMAVFDKASYHFAAKMMIERGAIYGTMVDGGTSSAMAIGPDAKGVRPGTAAGNWRPVATVFGFRAEGFRVLN
jgi:Phosphodiester glycosidase